MKSNSERIADLEKAITDLKNRFHALEDRVRIAESTVAEFQALQAAVDEATVQANTTGV